MATAQRPDEHLSSSRSPGRLGATRQSEVGLIPKTSISSAAVVAAGLSCRRERDARPTVPARSRSEISGSRALTPTRLASSSSLAPTADGTVSGEGNGGYAAESTTST